eukprot:m.1443790 g.1443790  ORF g.1443790 m.1443790 type:complete len:79 (+) comp25103_c0_seq16:589-825(+)
MQQMQCYPNWMKYKRTAAQVLQQGATRVHTRKHTSTPQTNGRVARLNGSITSVPPVDDMSKTFSQYHTERANTVVCTC